MRTDYGFVRVAAIVPRVTLADPDANVNEMVRLAQEAAEKNAQVIVFPELGITGYSCGDLFREETLIKGARRALKRFLEQTRGLHPLIYVGIPLAWNGGLYNVAVACQAGRPVAVIPKAFPPNYREFYGIRHFQPGATVPSETFITLAGHQDVPFGMDVLVELYDTDDAGESDDDQPFAVVGCEICEDGWTALPPSTIQALQGADLIVNLSASNELVGKAEYRRKLFTQQAERCYCGYIYVSCGAGESTADVVYGGHAMIIDGGKIVAESERFLHISQIIMSDIDIENLRGERRVTTSFGGSERLLAGLTFRRIEVAVPLLELSARAEEGSPAALLRHVDPFPFIPSDPATRDANVDELIAISVYGLMRRLEQAVGKTKSVTIGVSGGLDSLCALIFTVMAFDKLGWARDGIHAFTLPGPGTSGKTKSNAYRVMEALGVGITEQSITDITTQTLRAVGHEPCWHCAQCENAQARARTYILMTDGFVVGTGDLSEAALSWCTYNGDHMSMYNPNCCIPKTLVKFVVLRLAARDVFPEASAAMVDTANTEISPELIAPTDDAPVQSTEQIIGPYELHDFSMHRLVRYGFSPAKCLFLACVAQDLRRYRGVGEKPTGHSPAVIKRWLDEFLRRFPTGQFKRDAAPNGPKGGSVSLGQRGDWRMPADVSFAAWRRELEAIDPDTI